VAVLCVDFALGPEAVAVGSEPGLLAPCVLTCVGDVLDVLEVFREVSCADSPSEAAANATVRNTNALVMQASKLW
jgi:hypothetical protein